MIGISFRVLDAATHRRRVQKLPWRLPIERTLFYVRCDHFKENNSNQFHLRPESSCPSRPFFYSALDLFTLYPIMLDSVRLSVASLRRVGVQKHTFQ